MTYTNSFINISIHNYFCIASFQQRVGLHNIFRWIKRIAQGQIIWFYVCRQKDPFQVHICIKLNVSSEISGEKTSHMCDFMTENFLSQALYLPCFFPASALQSVKSRVVWKKDACGHWHGCWILGRETFQRKGETRPFPGASDQTQLAEPSRVQHGVVEVLTLKNITYSKKIHL